MNAKTLPILAVLFLGAAPQDRPKPVLTVTHWIQPTHQTDERKAVYETRTLRNIPGGVEILNAKRTDGEEEVKLKRVIFLSGRLEVE